MYQKILAPLDGSELAECSLEHVRTVATGCGVSEVVLLRVVEPLHASTIGALAPAGGDLIAKVEKDNRTEAEDYVSEMVERLKKEGVAVKGDIVNGRAADEILKYAEKNQPDLIIMSTHGRSGVSRWAFGSVADRIIHQSPIPVLIVSAPGCRLQPTM
ncbi:MAG: universal stress protein [Dehalococcoidales bacterium]|nr:universal stress protein [Dehalococcoidales bacterium]